MCHGVWGGVTEQWSPQGAKRTKRKGGQAYPGQTMVVSTTAPTPISSPACQTVRVWPSCPPLFGVRISICPETTRNIESASVSALKSSSPALRCSRETKGEEEQVSEAAAMPGRDAATERGGSSESSPGPMPTQTAG